MNILVPLAGDNHTKEGNLIPLVEINKKTVIEYVLDNLAFDKKDHFIFILKQSDCDKFHLDSILKLLKPNSTIIRVQKQTQGQLCSCLLAIGHINNNDPLLIVNGDQYLFEDVKKIIDFFKKSKADGGIVTFNSIHPKWSYALLAKNGKDVIQTSEKIPISRVACAGMFYFKTGKLFSEASKNVLKKDTSVNGKYFVSSTYNEMILMNRGVVAHQIKNENFFALDSDETIHTFGRKLKR